MRTPESPRIIGGAAVVLTVLLGFARSYREDYFSCHVCRARKEMRADGLFGWPIRLRQVIAYPGRTIPAHAHDWWKYGYHYGQGLGSFGIGVGSRASRYSDGTTMP